MKKPNLDTNLSIQVKNQFLEFKNSTSFDIVQEIHIFFIGEADNLNPNFNAHILVFDLQNKKINRNFSKIIK